MDEFERTKYKEAAIKAGWDITWNGRYFRASPMRKGLGSSYILDTRDNATDAWKELCRDQNIEVN